MSLPFPGRTMKPVKETEMITIAWAAAAVVTAVIGVRQVYFPLVARRLVLANARAQHERSSS